MPRGGAPSADQSAEKFTAYLQKCRESYAEVDARIAQAGVHDAEFVPVPGFPYVRTDRLMSSYRREVSGDINTLGTWMLQLRENDSIARDIELTNLGMPKYERADLLNTLRTCAVWLSYGELADPPTLERLLAAVEIPQAEATPLPARDEPTRRDRSTKAHLTVWKVAPLPDDPDLLPGLKHAARDELGRVGLLMNQWPELAARHAPQLLIESNEDDVVGAPILTADGAKVDAARPVVYYLPSYARVGNRTLVQLNYFVWLGVHKLDGLIWRVTLDDDGKPLLYDTISASGFDHQRFRPQGDVIRLRSGTHEVMKLLPHQSSAAAKAQRYELRPYEDLMTLAAPGGGTRSLFGPDGIVPGSNLRQWGHHPISASAQRYFDDPYLIEALSELTVRGELVEPHRSSHAARTESTH